MNDEDVDAATKDIVEIVETATREFAYNDSHKAMDGVTSDHVCFSTWNLANVTRAYTRDVTRAALLPNNAEFSLG